VNGGIVVLENCIFLEITSRSWDAAADYEKLSKHSLAVIRP
jgi:hypothetical protein